MRRLLVGAFAGGVLLLACQTGAWAQATAPSPQRVEEVSGLEYMVNLFKAGGWVMYFILALAIMGVVVAVERAMNLSRSRIAPHGLAAKADQLWQKGDFGGIVELCRQDRSSLAKVIEYIVEYRHASPADVSAGTTDIASEDIRQHTQRSYLLAIAATIAPLMGLFGTIQGMIGAFQKVAVAGGMGGDPGILAADISVALITTAAGLLVAMPALFIWHMYKMRTGNLATLLEKEANHLISRWLMKKGV